MKPLVARTGRHQQRYEQGYRLVAGCIPYRVKQGVQNCSPVEQNLEVLMVTSQRGGGFLFPKGGWETDETVEEAACREALEEAGVRGQVKACLGSWDFKSKRQQEDFSPEGLCRAYMYALAVNEELESWPEQHHRLRQWFSVAEAVKHCCHDWMCEALDKCLKYLSTSSSSLSNISSMQESSHLSDGD